jgi:hypothetical protein
VCLDVLGNYTNVELRVAVKGRNRAGAAGGRYAGQLLEALREANSATLLADFEPWQHESVLRAKATTVLRHMLSIVLPMSGRNGEDGGGGGGMKGRMKGMLVVRSRLQVVLFTKTLRTLVESREGLGPLGAARAVGGAGRGEGVGDGEEPGEGKRREEKGAGNGGGGEDSDGDTSDDEDDEREPGHSSSRNKSSSRRAKRRRRTQRSSDEFLENLEVYGAFSGDVECEGKSGYPESWNEGRLNLFETLDTASIIVVCNKLETGYDEPRLAALYVDRPLCGARAVQVLGRLSRPAAGKTAVHVVDFANTRDAIRDAFEEYWGETTWMNLDHTAHASSTLGTAGGVAGRGVFRDGLLLSSHDLCRIEWRMSRACGLLFASIPDLASLAPPAAAAQLLQLGGNGGGGGGKGASRGRGIGGGGAGIGVEQGGSALVMNHVSSQLAVYCECCESTKSQLPELPYTYARALLASFAKIKTSAASSAARWQQQQHAQLLAWRPGLPRLRFEHRARRHHSEGNEDGDTHNLGAGNGDDAGAASAHGSGGCDDGGGSMDGPVPSLNSLIDLRVSTLRRTFSGRVHLAMAARGRSSSSSRQHQDSETGLGDRLGTSGGGGNSGGGDDDDDGASRLVPWSGGDGSGVGGKSANVDESFRRKQSLQDYVGRSSSLTSASSSSPSSSSPSTSSSSSSFASSSALSSVNRSAVRRHFLATSIELNGILACDDRNTSSPASNDSTRSETTTETTISSSSGSSSSRTKTRSNSDNGTTAVEDAASSWWLLDGDDVDGSSEGGVIEKKGEGGGTGTPPGADVDPSVVTLPPLIIPDAPSKGSGNGSGDQEETSSSSSPTSKLNPPSTGDGDAADRAAVVEVECEPRGTTSHVLGILRRLRLVPGADAESLKSIGIGRLVGQLRKHAHRDVRIAAKDLVSQWKQDVRDAQALVGRKALVDGGDPRRATVVKGLGKVFTKALADGVEAAGRQESSSSSSGGGGSNYPVPTDAAVLEAAQSVEAVLFQATGGNAQGKPYRTRARQLLGDLRRPHNHQLCGQIVRGTETPLQLLARESSSLADPAMLAEAARHRKASLKNTVFTTEHLRAKTVNYIKCPGCKGNEVILNEVPMRDADHVRKQCAECVLCGYRWQPGEG